MDILLSMLCVLLYISAPSVRATEWCQLQVSRSSGEEKSSLLAVGSSGESSDFN